VCCVCCVCVCVCLVVRAHARAHEHDCLCLRACVCVCVFVRICVHVCVCVHACVCVCVCTRACVCVRVCVCVILTRTCSAHLSFTPTPNGRFNSSVLSLGVVNGTCIFGHVSVPLTIPNHTSFDTAVCLSPPLPGRSLRVSFSLLHIHICMYVCVQGRASMSQRQGSSVQSRRQSQRQSSRQGYQRRMGWFRLVGSIKL